EPDPALLEPILPAHRPLFRSTHSRLLVLAAFAAQAGVAFAQTGTVQQLEDIQVLGTAQEELKQAPGVSIIGQEDIEKSPPANDLSEIIRKQPGVNLTGNSGSGARGNNR